MAFDVKNLFLRSISGIIYVGLIIGAIILGRIGMAILMSAFAIVGSFELESKSLGAMHKSNWFSTWCIDAAMLVSLICWACFPNYGLLFILWLLLLIVRFIAQIFIIQKSPLFSIATSFFTLIYIGAPLALFAVVDNLVFNPWILVCAISMIWINDTGAYLVGCTLGRHKMSPRLSPKKSWEGLLGGVLLNIGAAFIFYYCFDLKIPGQILGNVQGWIFIGICVSAMATLGDLFESMLKRSLDIKDFGNIIPGHGGVLDRIDSLLFVVPGVLLMVLIGSAMFIP